MITTSQQQSLKITYLSAIATTRICIKWAKQDSVKVAIIASQFWQKVTSPEAIARYKFIIGVIGLAALTVIAAGNETYKAGAKFSSWCDDLVQECLIEIPDVEDHEAIAAYVKKVEGIRITADEIVAVEPSEAQPGRLILSLNTCSWNIPGTVEQLQRVQNQKIQKAIAQWSIAHLPEWFKSSITHNYFDFMRSVIA